MANIIRNVIKKRFCCSKMRAEMIKSPTPEPEKERSIQSCDCYGFFQSGKNLSELCRGIRVFSYVLAVKSQIFFSGDFPMGIMSNE